MQMLKVGVVRTEGICGGSPRIDGTRIRVVDIVAYYKAGKSPEEIASVFKDSIDLGDVHAAISYYYKNRQEIEGEEKETESLIKELLKKHPTKVAK